MLSHINSGNFVYLYSDGNGLKVLKNTDQISTNIGIFVPKNVEINLKSNFIESSNNLTPNCSINKGLIELKSGFHSDVCFKISNNARLEEIKKDDFIGAFITNKKS
jgi:hypothetical protein